MGEIKWFPVVGYDDYLISEVGVWSKRRSKIMAFSMATKGYFMVQFYKDGVAECKFFHRLLAINFIPNPENKPQVNHKNGIKTDNRLSNLEWVTSKENCNHALVTGLAPTGERHSRNRLTKEQVLEILSSSTPHRQLAKKYNVHRSTIHHIKTGRSWTYI